MEAPTSRCKETKESGRVERTDSEVMVIGALTTNSNMIRWVQLKNRELVMPFACALEEMDPFFYCSAHMSSYL